MVKVLKAGFYSTIQDRGRSGQRSFGVPVSGAMDAYSSELANKLLENDNKAAVIEMTMTGAELQFLKPTTIAITGANMNPKLNGNSISMFKSVTVNVNDMLSFGSVVNGFRTYLAVKGGFLTEMVLGSRSMANGITETNRIHKDDVLNISNSERLLMPSYAKLKNNTSFLDNEILEVFKGPEFEKLTINQQQMLFCETFQVSKYNNRMAYQLLPTLKNNLQSILTAPVLPGTIQLTPSGQLIVLMRDSQTTGGYPRVLQLTEKSTNILSQKSTNALLNFRLHTI